MTSTKKLFSEREESEGESCLGIDFDSSANRREHFRADLRVKIDEMDLRNRSDFPVGDIDDLIELSDPPFYCACPNPFITDFIKHNEVPTSNELVPPFASDVSEGKGSSVYNAHGYHTKVPHQALMRYILHYTKPGEVVLDAFCGTGMTGVAGQLCGDKGAVASLGYEVDDAGIIINEEGEKVSSLGSRKVVVSDLGTAPTFISYGYNLPTDPAAYVEITSSIIDDLNNSLSYLFHTLHEPATSEVIGLTSLIETNDDTWKNEVLDAKLGRVHYMVWSDIFLCNECNEEIVFWHVAVIENEGKVRSKFNCPHCGVETTKRRLTLALESKMDPITKEVVRHAKQVPVYVNYTYGGKTYKKKPDTFDLALIKLIESLPIPQWFPSDRMPEGDESRRNDSRGMTHIHHFYSARNRLVLSELRAFAKSDPAVLWTLTGMLLRASKQHQIAITRIGGPKAGQGGATAGHRRGTWYVPSNQVEFNPIHLFAERAQAVERSLRKCSSMVRSAIVSTNSATGLLMEDNSVDYIFVDPPFGGNIMYSELNFSWEAMLGVLSNAEDEAVTSSTQGKKLEEYRELMVSSFCEFHRVLKPGKWLTVEFHNSKNSVWNAIQEALQRAGFIIADVRTLDKKLKTHTQRTAAGSVNQDLVITAYKATAEEEEQLMLLQGTVEAVWQFTNGHLSRLPVAPMSEGVLETIAERTNYVLFDRMIAYHIQRGIHVPISAAEFYEGLSQRYPERDGMFFLPEQVQEYEKRRLTAAKIEQLELFVFDENSAIQWIRQQLKEKPQTFQEIQPEFIKELGGWNKNEKKLELSDILEENFLKYDGKHAVPSQIYDSLPKEFRNLEKDDSALQKKARDCWYVPDPRKEADLEKIRTRNLLREFKDYCEASIKLKVVRTEALRAGFHDCWQRNDYHTILKVASRVKGDTINEDEVLLQYKDAATIRTEE